MWGFNWIDLVIALLLMASAIQGVRLGLVRQLLVIVGFFGVLFAAGWLIPHALPIADQSTKALLNVLLVVLLASAAGFACLRLGDTLHWSIKTTWLGRWEKWSGGVPGVLAGLVLVWLLGVAIGRLPFAGFSNSVRDSWVVGRLSDALPPAPVVFGVLNRQLDPNSPPVVNAQPRPSADFNYIAADIDQATAKAEASVVRITSFGCGGLVSGSGVVLGDELVATNAHVIAGVKRPIIKYQGGSYEGVPVLFNNGLDLAFVRVKGLPARPLGLAMTKVSDNTSAAVIGYPGGNYQVAPGMIRENIEALGHNSRLPAALDTYGIQTTTAEGGSGGPVVLPGGEVAGIIFSRADARGDYAYAIASVYIARELARAEPLTAAISTGACTAG